MHNLNFTAQSWCQCGEVEQNLLRALLLLSLQLSSRKAHFFVFVFFNCVLTTLLIKITAFAEVAG